MFTKETNLEIVKVLKLYGPICNRDKANWKMIHAQLAKNIREIKRVTIQDFKREVLKLMFDIKQNKFNLSQETLQMLCYPYLDKLLKIKLIIRNTPDYKKIPTEKLNRQKIIIKYLLSNSFDQELWDKLHEISEQHPEEYHIINLKNPLYCLTDKETMILNRLVYDDKSKKSRKIPLVWKQHKWLSKKAPVNKLIDTPKHVDLDGPNMEKECDTPNMRLQENAAHANKRSEEIQEDVQYKENKQSSSKGSKSNVAIQFEEGFIQNYSVPCDSSETEYPETSDPPEKSVQVAYSAACRFNETSTNSLPTLSNGSALANSSISVPFRQTIDPNNEKSSLEEPTTEIEISSDEEEFTIPYSFYDDISSDSEMDIDEPMISTTNLITKTIEEPTKSNDIDDVVICDLTEIMKSKVPRTTESSTVRILDESVIEISDNE